jgi:hypothetical protein
VPPPIGVCVTALNPTIGWTKLPPSVTCGIRWATFRRS